MLAETRLVMAIFMPLVIACPGDKEGLQDDEIAIEYRAPFVLPWVVIEEAMAKQPESFVPFTAGSQGTAAELRSGCCCALTCSLVTCVPGCIAM